MYTTNKKNGILFFVTADSRRTVAQPKVDVVVVSDVPDPPTNVS